MATRASGFIFSVPGQVQASGLPALPGGISSSHSVRVGNQRGEATLQRMHARSGQDVVALTLEDGPVLVLHPENARDLMLAQAATPRSAADADVRREVSVPDTLAWPALESASSRGTRRGWLGRVVLKSIDVVTGFGIEDGAGIAAAAITRKIDGAVAEGVYKLERGAAPGRLKEHGVKLSSVPHSAGDAPLLVLIHGTFVDTSSTFGKLWSQQPAVLDRIFKAYGDNIYALEHATMAVSPLDNALTLVKAMPAGARLHLVTHSRGGLVAEALARACSGADVTDKELECFADPEYARHRLVVAELAAQARAKGLRIERVVRVACPAHGTLLASGRLDAYLSVLQWMLQLAEVPVLPAFVEFLHEVARRRSDPRELPGIEAMMPESAFIRWLKLTPAAPGQLRVVAGDIEADGVISWLKTLLTDAFYWTDHDLVVQTRSMYGGIPRVAKAGSPQGATYYLDRGAKVNHFNYFANADTAGAICRALLEDSPAEFQPVGPLSWRGADSEGYRGAVHVGGLRGKEEAVRPAVFLLPGLLGSNLALDDERLWISFRFVNNFDKLAWRGTQDRIVPQIPLEGAYNDLIERLRETHAVFPFAYDWRRPIEDEAARLADSINEQLELRAASGQPVRIVAHSMGGILARTMQLVRADVWDKMMARTGARILMLGTPNGGSWAPMQTLSGDDTFGNLLTFAGSPFDAGLARRTMASMPGFLQLQAGLLDPELALGQHETWKTLAERDEEVLRGRSLWHHLAAQLQVYRWYAPSQEVLKQAVGLRRRLDGQLSALARHADRIVMVLGLSDFTPGGMAMGENGLEYLNSPGGDGRVTQANALLPGVAAWRVDAEHGKLPQVRQAYTAYEELLAQGTTAKLPAVQVSMERGAGAAPAGRQHVPTLRTRRSREAGWVAPPMLEQDVMAGPGSAGAEGAALGVPWLKVAVRNCNLKFIRQALMIGHYRSYSMAGAEAVVNLLIGGSMAASLAGGLYPDRVGTHQIFGNICPNPDNPMAMPRPSSAIVVGLGEEGDLEARELSETVRQGVLAYAQWLSERDQRLECFSIASTLLGSGGTHISPGTAALAIVKGAVEAGDVLRNGSWPRLEQLILVELYEDRATEAWHALHLEGLAQRAQIDVAPLLEFGPGAFRRPPDVGYRSASFDFISALMAQGDDKASPVIAYTLDSRRARTEVRAQRTQGRLLRELVSQASNSGNTDPTLGRTLFNLLVPVEIEPYMNGGGAVVMEVGPGTAGIPWEMLDTVKYGHDSDQAPWAIRCKLVRKLQTKSEHVRAQISDARRDDNVLVIGEPLCDPKRYPRLDGARREAAAVAQVWQSPTGVGQDKCRLLADHDTARVIITALFDRPYRIVHIAGHGEPGTADSAGGGVVLSGDKIYLGPNEIRSLRTIPELVFLNCCHLAARSADSTLAGYDRSEFAANIAEELIRCGVRCVIAAGWAVNDSAAEKFATTFYEALLAGERYMDAVGRARMATWQAWPADPTWAAYQCYGDPDWRWQAQTGDTAGTSGPAPQRQFTRTYAEVATPTALVLELESVALECEFEQGSKDAAIDRLHYLDHVFGIVWGHLGAVAEAYGIAYRAAGKHDMAIGWYERAINAQDGCSSFRAGEQLANLKVRRAGKAANLEQGRNDLESGKALLEQLLAIRPTVERLSLMGSCYKRWTMLAARERKGKRPGQEELRLLELAAQFYEAAEQMARDRGVDRELFYPAKAAIGCALRLAMQNRRPAAIDAGRILAVQNAMKKVASEDPDFWSVVGQTEMQMLAAVVAGKLVAAESMLTAEFHGHKARVPAPTWWDSVANEAEFVLAPYAAVAEEGEGQAALRLTALLGTFCGH